MAFDVDAYHAAHRPWSVTIQGRTYGACHVSAPQVLRYERMMRDAAADIARQTRALSWLLRRAFPWRFSYLLRGDPVRLVLNLDGPARNEAFKDFFACLRGQTTGATPQTAPIPKTRGMRSPAQTPLRSA